MDRNESIETAIGNSIKGIRGSKENADNLSSLTPLSPKEMRLVLERILEVLICETPKNSDVIRGCVPRNLDDPERGEDEGEVDNLEISVTVGLMNL